MTSITGRRADCSFECRPAHGPEGHATTRPRGPCHAAGFTLFELILVMLIVTILAALAAPSLRGFLIGRKSTDAVTQLMAVAQYARTQAIGSGNVYRLNFDPSTQTYWLTIQKGMDSIELGTEFGRTFQLPDGTQGRWVASESEAQDYIDFYPDGRVEAARLELVDSSGKVVAIGCKSETEPLSVL